MGGVSVIGVGECGQDYDKEQRNRQIVYESMYFMKENNEKITFKSLSRALNNEKINFKFRRTIILDMNNSELEEALFGLASQGIIKKNFFGVYDVINYQKEVK